MSEGSGSPHPQSRAQHAPDLRGEELLRRVGAGRPDWSGQSVVVATGTASGKSLAYQLPVLAAMLSDDRATALYLSPTKALSNDQLRSVRDLTLVSIRASAYDGDTPADEWDWVRAHARWVFTNPDMLHRGILPGHQRWSSFLRRLRYVVVDECHAYRGLFGSHVAHVLRRLRRACQRYGATPVFILASATSGDPAASASRLTGLAVQAVDVDTSPHAATAFAQWEPPLTELVGERGAPVRRSAGAEAAQLLTDLVIEGARTLAFVRSRRGAEILALQARRLLTEAGAGDLARRVAAYRAGYLPEERRELEAALSSGRLLGVACGHGACRASRLDDQCPRRHRHRRQAVAARGPARTNRGALRCGRRDQPRGVLPAAADRHPGGARRGRSGLAAA